MKVANRLYDLQSEIKRIIFGLVMQIIQMGARVRWMSQLLIRPPRIENPFAQ